MGNVINIDEARKRIRNKKATSWNNNCSFYCDNTGVCEYLNSLHCKLHQCTKLLCPFTAINK